MRILVDQDSVLYDLSTPWYDLHNQDYGHIHTITIDDVVGWDTSQVCKDNSCPSDIYSYFNNPSVWTYGNPIEDSQYVTKLWVDYGYTLGILTTAANTLSLPHKVEWLQLHFPHISNILLVYKTHIKHWVEGDILIDDGIHNLEKFTGISILYDQPWNRAEHRFPRARDWNHVQVIVSRIGYLLNIFNPVLIKSKEHKWIEYNWIEHRIKHEIESGEL